MSTRNEKFSIILYSGLLFVEVYFWWIQYNSCFHGETNIYTANKGSFEGDSLYETDNTSEPGKIKFRIYNSINITEQIDLGNVNLRLTGKTPATADGTPGNIFIVIQTLFFKSIKRFIQDFCIYRKIILRMNLI